MRYTTDCVGHGDGIPETTQVTEKGVFGGGLMEMEIGRGKREFEHRRTISENQRE